MAFRMSRRNFSSSGSEKTITFLIMPPVEQKGNKQPNNTERYRNIVKFSQTNASIVPMA